MNIEGGTISVGGSVEGWSVGIYLYVKYFIYKFVFVCVLDINKIEIICHCIKVIQKVITI